MTEIAVRGNISFPLLADVLLAGDDHGQQLVLGEAVLHLLQERLGRGRVEYAAEISLMAASREPSNGGDEV